MPIGAFTGQFDLPLLLVIVFVLFFFALVYHLQQESKREGYPLVAPSRKGRTKVVGFPGLPKPKAFILPHGMGTVYAPKAEELRALDATNVGNPNGMPISPNGEKLGSGMGPGSWVERRDEPDLNVEGTPVFRPMRFATAFKVAKSDPNPIGYAVLGCDKQLAGTVVDIWIDQSEHHAKFLEVALSDDLFERRRVAPPQPVARETRVVGAVVTDEIIDTALGEIERIEVNVIEAPLERNREDAAPAGGHILIPLDFAAVNASKRIVRCGAITARQFADVPGRRRDLSITALEENKLRGYFGGGFLWATPQREEPIV